MSGRTTKFFPFDGGENLADPVITMKAGELHDSMNYENNASGGYKRVQGFERFDGQLSPASIEESSYQDHASWVAAVEAARALINPVTGSGPIRGIWQYKGEKYAFRDNAAATAAGMFKATPTGWVEITPESYIEFDTGNIGIYVGDTIVGDTSGATAVVDYIAITSGEFGSGNAAGRIYYHSSNRTGTFQVETLSVQGATGTASITAIEVTEAALPAGGKYEFINKNFWGLSDRMTMFGVNGVGYAFAFTGNGFFYIKTGSSIDKPTHIYAHKNHLFLSFDGGSIQHSAAGLPEDFSGLLGASELAIGDNCTGFSGGPQNTLVIFARNIINILYGVGVADWNMTTYSYNTGAVEWTIQDINQPFFLDDRGIKSLSATQAYGDFSMNTHSQKVQKRIDDNIGNAISSLKVRKKDQYRLFYNDGTCLILSFFKGKIRGITRADYGSWDGSTWIPKIFNCAVSVEATSGEEELFVADLDGYVYRMDYGNSFDGNIIQAYIKPVFYHFGSPENFKRFMKISLEIDTLVATNMTFQSEFSYGDPYFPAADEDFISIRSGAGIWGQSYWDNFFWDSQSLSTAYGYLTGIGKNFRLIIKSEGIYESPHTIQGAIVHYSNKGYVK